MRCVLKFSIKNERGQAIVETAIILPIIVLLLMGMVEFGRLSNAYMAVTHAGRHGARHAIVGGSNEEIISRVKNAAAPLEPDQLTVTIEPQTGRVSGQDVRVTVTYPFQMITPLTGAIFKEPLVVRSDVTMRIE